MTITGGQKKQRQVWKKDIIIEILSAFGRRLILMGNQSNLRKLLTRQRMNEVLEMTEGRNDAVKIFDYDLWEDKND